MFGVQPTWWMLFFRGRNAVEGTRRLAGGGVLMLLLEQMLQMAQQRSGESKPLAVLRLNQHCLGLLGSREEGLKTRLVLTSSQGGSDHFPANLWVMCSCE